MRPLALTVKPDQPVRTPDRPSTIARLGAGADLVLRRLEGGGDTAGLVPVASAKWGEFLGVEELDHIEQINFPLKLVNVNEPWGMWRRIIALCEAEEPG